MNIVITIARQYGSGGREIGLKLSERLGIPFYDKELITLAAEKSGMSSETVSEVDEKAASSLLYTLAVGSSYMHGSMPHNVPINDRLFATQCDVIKDLANQGSCIIVGRCADYVLSQHPNCIKTFICADFDARVATVQKRYDFTEAKAKDLIMKTDKRRANYYNYYTNQKWGKSENYDLIISTSKVGVDGAVNMIAAYYESLVNKK